MKKKHIDVLIIEDSPADFKLAAMLLKESAVPSFGIHHAVRLEEALKMLETENFDIVLMDLDLPDSTGLDGLNKIMEKPGHPPVVVLTGLEDEEMGLKALKKQASDFLVKGRLTLNSLTRSLLYALTRQEMEQELLNERRNLQKIFDAVNVGMILLDESGVVQRANDAISRWLGKDPLSAGELQPGNLLGCIHALSISQGCGHTPHCSTCVIRKTFEAVLSSGQPLHGIETEATFLIKGQRVPLDLDISVDPLVLNGKRHVILVVNNITGRKRVEAALRESEERLRLAQEKAHVGIWDWNITTGALEVTPELNRLYGLPPGTIKTYQDWRQRVHPEDIHRIEIERDEAITDHGPFDLEFRGLHVSGEYRWISTRGGALYDDAGKAIRAFGINIDIHGHKQAEESLRQSQMDLDRAQAVGQTGSWRLDISRNILMWSDENYRIFDIPRGTPLTYETFLGAVHPDDRTHVDAQWKAALGGKPYDIEHRIIVGGQVRWVREKAYLEFDEAKQLTGGFGITQDITDLKRVEEKLRESEERFRSVFEHAATGIAITDWEGTFVQCNAAYSAMTGYSEEDLREMVFPLLIHPDDRGKNMEFIRRMQGGEIPGFEIENRYIHKNGSCVWVYKYVSALRDSRGKATHLVALVTDMTVRKQAEEILMRDKETFERLVQERTEELLDARARLAQSKRLSDIGALAATVAHELRTPLGVIRIGAYNMKRKSTDPALLKHIAHIETKVLELDKIINNLLLYSRIKTPNREEVRLYDLLTECVDIMKENLDGRPVRVVTQFNAIKDESLRLDPLQIKEVFHNILTNAAEALAGPKEGKITVSASRRGPEGEIAIAFEDNGIGINESDLKRIHEPFFTTKSKGTGLGLSVCFEIIHQHDGRIEVTSKKEEGSVFTVILPCRGRMAE